MNGKSKNNILQGHYGRQIAELCCRHFNASSTIPQYLSTPIQLFVIFRTPEVMIYGNFTSFR